MSKVTATTTFISHLKALVIWMALGMWKKSKSLIRSVCPYLMVHLYVTYHLARGYFHTKNEMTVVNIVEVIIEQIWINTHMDGRTDGWKIWKQYVSHPTPPPTTRHNHYVVQGIIIEWLIRQWPLWNLFFFKQLLYPIPVWNWGH